MSLKLIRKSIILLGLVLALLGIKNLGTHAWYASNNDGQISGYMGMVDTSAEEKPSPRLMSMSSVNDTNIVKNFTIQNNSTIDTFVRLSYTISFFNENGEEVMVDSSKVNLTAASVLVNNKDVGIINEEINSSGYSKRFIIPAEGEGANKCYLKISPGEDINGSFNFETIEAEGLTAEIAISAETIQATLKAVQNASGYGWSESYFREIF